MEICWMPELDLDFHHAIGWAVTFLCAAVLALFQFSIMGQITELKQANIMMNQHLSATDIAVGELGTGRIDDELKINRLSIEIDEVRDSFEKSQQQKLNSLGERLKAKQFALAHEREHASHETKALTNELVKKAVMSEDP